MAEYIERAMALAAIEEEEKDYDFDTRDVLSGLYIAEDCISKIPSADVVPVRHGRWDKAGYVLARCSFCHTVRKTDFARDHYCPNCGAKMDGEETEK